MARDPAFLFYSSDFLSGISDLTMEERGQYITLLCVQHQKGGLTEKTIRLLVGSVSVDVMAKFLKDENGNFYNKRLKEETEKRNKFTESRRNNGSLGGRPKEKKKPTLKAKKNHMVNHMEDENEDINKKEVEVKIEKKAKIEILEMPDDFKPLWSEWLEYRKAKKKKPYAGPKWEQIAINNFLETSNFNFTTAQQILKQTIEHNWEGLHELKADKNGTATKTNLEIATTAMQSETAKNFRFK